MLVGAAGIELEALTRRLSRVPKSRACEGPHAGRRGRDRTCNPGIRNPVLYPIELRALKNLRGPNMWLCAKLHAIGFTPASAPQRSAKPWRVTAGILPSDLTAKTRSRQKLRPDPDRLSLPREC